MALWKEQSKERFPKESNQSEGPLASAEAPHGGQERSQKKDSLIADDLTVEGIIKGSGNVRIAGRFHGDIHVEGNLTIESGAHVKGDIRAETIHVGGEVHGNVHANSEVKLLESGTLIGDLKGTSLTVVVGACMRGKAEFGWDEGEIKYASVSEEGEAT